jgi:hypothetical protein
MAYNKKPIKSRSAKRQVSVFFIGMVGIRECDGHGIPKDCGRLDKSDTMFPPI